MNGLNGMLTTKASRRMIAKRAFERVAMKTLPVQQPSVVEPIAASITDDDRNKIAAAQAKRLRRQANRL